MAGATNRMLELVEKAKDERDAAEQQRDRLLEAIDKERYTAAGSLQNSKAKKALYDVAAAIESEVGKVMSTETLIRPEFTETQAIAALEACKREAVMAKRAAAVG
jgi:hypothetical protein